MKLRSASRAMLCMQAPAVIFDNRAAGRQPEPHTFGLAGHERLKDIIQQIRRQTGARVCNAHRHVVVPLGGRSNERAGGALDAGVHRLDGVADKLDKHLLNMDPRCRHRWEIPTRPHLGFDSATAEFGGGQLQNVF